MVLSQQCRADVGQVKHLAANSESEMCGSGKVRRKSLKSEWWNDKVKAAVERKESEWKCVVEEKYEGVRESCMEIYKEEKRIVKGKNCQSKKDEND